MEVLPGPDAVDCLDAFASAVVVIGNRHHAVATPFSRMLALAGRCPVRDQVDDDAWGQSASITALPAAGIAAFACQVAGWPC